MRKLHLADLTSDQQSTNEKPTFSATLTSTQPATKRTNHQGGASSYRKQFTPMLLLETVRLEASIDKKPAEQAKRKLIFEEDAQENTTRHINVVPQTSRLDLHNLKRQLLETELERYRPPLNLEYEIRKKRFFQTFGRGKSYSHLSKYRQ